MAAMGKAAPAAEESTAGNTAAVGAVGSTAGAAKAGTVVFGDSFSELMDSLLIPAAGGFVVLVLSYVLCTQVLCPV